MMCSGCRDVVFSVIHVSSYSREFQGTLCIILQPIPVELQQSIDIILLVLDVGYSTTLRLKVSKHPRCGPTSPGY